MSENNDPADAGGDPNTVRELQRARADLVKLRDELKTLAANEIQRQRSATTRSNPATVTRAARAAENGLRDQAGRGERRDGESHD